MDDSGWDRSAKAWIRYGDGGDWTREHVLDQALLARVDAWLASGAMANALDVGCGAGRFCRMLAARGVQCSGIDPTRRLIEEARSRDPEGNYMLGVAEELPFANGSFDLVVSYMTLIDIADYRAAISEMARTLAPGGTLLIANLNGFATVPTHADDCDRWVRSANGEKLHHRFDKYMDETAYRERWKGIDIVNYHRPLSAYFKALLGQGLQLIHFDEPEPISADPVRTADYRRMPYALVMEWAKS